MCQGHMYLSKCTQTHPGLSGPGIRLEGLRALPLAQHERRRWQFPWFARGSHQIKLKLVNPVGTTGTDTSLAERSVCFLLDQPSSCRRWGTQIRWRRIRGTPIGFPAISLPRIVFRYEQPQFVLLTWNTLGNKEIWQGHVTREAPTLSAETLLAQPYTTCSRCLFILPALSMQIKHHASPRSHRVCSPR